MWAWTWTGLRSACTVDPFYLFLSSEEAAAWWRPPPALALRRVPVLHVPWPWEPLQPVPRQWSPDGGCPNGKMQTQRCWKCFFHLVFIFRFHSNFNYFFLFRFLSMLSEKHKMLSIEFKNLLLNFFKLILCFSNILSIWAFLFICLCIYLLF